MMYEYVGMGIFIIEVQKECLKIFISLFAVQKLLAYLHVSNTP